MAATDTTSSQLEELLGDDASDLLGHTCQTIDKSQLHLPGPTSWTARSWTATAPRGPSATCSGWPTAAAWPAPAT